MEDYSLLANLDQQSALAEIMRGRKRSADQERLQNAFRKGHRFDDLAAVTQLMNNQAAAAAAGSAQKSAVANKPVPLGQTGFMLPESGDFIESPMYAAEKNAARAGQRDMLRDRLDTQTAEGRERRALQETLGRMNEQGRNDRAEEGRTLRALIAGMANQLGRDRLDAKGAGGKTLASSEVRKFSEQEGIASTMGEIASSFKDEFGGQGARPVASVQNMLGRYQPFGVGKGYAEQSNWWQNYNDQTNLLRHKLFGSALTAPERAAFDSANATEGMAPDLIRTRLAQQHQAAVRAYNKLKTSFAKAGYNMSEFQDMLEPEVKQKPGVVEPKPAQTAQTTSDDDLINKYRVKK